MFRGRKKLQRRDHESGLSFNWRLPVSNSGTFIMAFIIVGIMAVAIAAIIRVQIEGPAVEDEVGRNTLIIVPEGEGGAWMERQAIESGPFPVRWNPAADPEYTALRRKALHQATEAGMPYQNMLLEIAWPDDEEDTVEESIVDLDLPPLPKIEESEPIDGPLEVTVQCRVIKSGGDIRLQHARLSLPAVEAPDMAGWKFLIQYDADGRVLEVTPLSAGARKEVLVDWLGRSRVAGHADQPGYLVVESVIGL